MKMKKILLGSSVLLGLATLASCGSNSNNAEKVTIWVSEVEGVVDLTKQQVEKFNQENPDLAVEADIQGISESDSATKMVTDVETGADIFCFAQDQLNRLVEAGALSQLGKAASDFVSTNNNKYSVDATKVNGQIYAYPITADNGYFMIYNKSVISQENIGSLEAIVAECEAKGYNFSMENETSAWYLASWFFGAGCHSTWTANTDGSFASVDDDFNSDNGLIAMKGMQHLVKSANYVSSSQASDLGAAVPSAVVVTGTWGVSTAKSILKENFAAAPLPKFTVDGNSYQMSSYSGFKLMGVKPSTNAERSAKLHKLAQYLSNETSQLERFNNFGWGPSNIAAAGTDAVKNDDALSALALQQQYAVTQGQIHGSWWDLAKVLGTVAKNSTTDDELKAGLQTYQDAIDALFSMSEEELKAFTVIGGLNNTNWTTDFKMTETSTGVWISDDTFTITQDDIDNGRNEYKVRQGKSWTINYGADGVLNGGNAKITTPGSYKIKLTITDSSVTLEAITQ